MKAIHPGEHLAEELREIGMSAAEFSRQISVPTNRVTQIRRVTFAIERCDKGGVKPVAVFRFLSEDWSPWIALLHMRERWSELRFEMKAEYLEFVA